MARFKADPRTVPRILFYFFMQIDWCALVSFSARRFLRYRGSVGALLVRPGRGLVLDLSCGASLNFYADVWTNKNVPVLNDNLSQVALLGCVAVFCGYCFVPSTTELCFYSICLDEMRLFDAVQTFFFCVRNRRPLQMLSAKVFIWATDMN